ncbi:TIGR03857 family LLM class F420-dependent oxidoreductase [Trujillonella endophytica]|uniref:Probable F420-dependent oxidoreductase, MSMEG_2249 family n=1 Tax=Trujillonella endophytica TaxID=673521 RepID=A0A1H8T6C4_9ACTN|nr:TIGR03857 family LLM class F420-dependent oxidoreductase [Trujillella endophytica]SEO86477.1 probable F420-dependent oxidoreductase, MSMEG_2249 family [Trujillella endophytica]
MSTAPGPGGGTAGSPTDAAPLGELGFYTLAGHSDSPRDLVREVQEAEALGLGSAFVSERLALKEAATLCGAAAAVTSTLGIATAATNHNTRHPLVTASIASTMHRLTGGRFTLGLGRGVAPMHAAMGLSTVTNAQLEDVTGILRTLWRGGAVVDHDGPAGTFPNLRQDATFDEDIPLLLVAIGPRSAELAGRVMDALVLHTFYSDEALTNAVAAARRGAEQAGRDPAGVRVWSVLATVGDHVPEDLRLKKTVGRLASYLRGYGDVLVAANGWDPAVLERFRADPFVRGFVGAFDARATQDELEYLAALMPDEWLAVTASGSPEQCAAAVVRQLDLGADSVILHGATPSELAPILPAYRAVRPAGLAGMPLNPGRSGP